MLRFHLTHVLLPAVLTLAPAFAQDSYVQHNLVSSISGIADHTDANLINAWGIDRSPTGPWWVNANGTGLSIVYDATGAPAPAASPIVVTVPPAGGASPSGLVFNSTLDFQIVNARQSLFLFAAENGVISGWNNQFNATNAAVKVAADAVFKGLTIGQIGTQNMLYAADFHNGMVDLFDANFVSPFMPSGSFQDANIPVGFAPFNVQNIDGTIWVTYAKQDDDREDDVKGNGNGYVDAYTPDGKLLMSLQHGDWMNSPWAVVKAPANFGKFSGDLLVGNFGSGQVAAFDPNTGKFLGLMMDANGKPIAIDGLWGLKFGNGASAGPVNVLFFSAGPNDEDDGLFGMLSVTPAPAPK